jgi:hypothetical protein
MGFEDDLRRIDEHIAEARRLVQRQKGLMIRLRAAGVSTWDAQRILWLLESKSTAIGGAQRPAQGKRPCSGQRVTFITLVTRQASDIIRVSAGYSRSRH